MQRIWRCLLALLLLTGAGQATPTALAEDLRHGIGEDYDPASPGNPGSTTGETPQKTYRLTLIANPKAGGEVYTYDGNLTANSQTYVYSYPAGGFKFVNWTIGDEVVSTSTSFYFTMPEHDVTLTANFIFDPSSPGNPSPVDQKVTHPVTVSCEPRGSASMNPYGTFNMEEHTDRYIYAYPESGWKLTGWMVNGEPMEQTTSPLYITMGEKALDIKATLYYDPSSPSNPAANYYNPSTGQLILDDFTPGYIYSAVSNLMGYNEYDNVSCVIVKGEITSNDIGNLSQFRNAGTLDLSRTWGLPALPSYAFENSRASDIILPSTLTRIGNYAFYDCVNLASITIYAQEPPECDNYAFDYFTNKENCTVYVPASAIELYSSDEQWKDFLILPITNDAHILQVNLPEVAQDGRYKHYSLEIVNVNSGIRQKYVVADRMLYTFNGLQMDEQYNIYLFSQSGLEVGRVENVVIPDKDIEITLDNLKTLHNVTAKVTDIAGTDLTDKVTVEWLRPVDGANPIYLRKAASISEIPEGQELICRVTLDNKLGSMYSAPADIIFTAGGNVSNMCEVTLVPFRNVILSGTVTDGDGAPLNGASVSATQTLNGKYPKTFTAKTDRQGKWSMIVLDAPETQMTYAAPECINVTATVPGFEAETSSLDLGKTVLKSIVGARVSYAFTYHEPGSDDTENYYPDYQNVLIDVYNVTQERPHDDVSMQYPLLAVLDENINAGDQLRLTATSKTGAFKPIEKMVTLGDHQRTEVTFDIVGKGGISAQFEMTDNAGVLALLYSKKGELVKKTPYAEAKALFSGLDDGDYTLISMGESTLMGSILKLSSFAEIGLTEGKDYVKNDVQVESGRLTEVKNPEIPIFDESLFYYTTSTTGFSSNKSSVTTGNYLTLRSAIDFKGVYKNDISNVALVVDLPEACDMVEQSVIQGPTLLPYTLDNNRLTIQLGKNYQSQTRFCVLPTAGGSFNATASVVFDYNGKTVMQPIGSAVAEIKELEFIVPSIITSETFQASGMAPGGSKIEIYGDDSVIGSTSALANGTWKADCTMLDTYNLSTHSLHAIITTPAGSRLTSESYDIELDRGYVSPKTVLMSFFNEWLHKNVNVTFDFENLTIDNPGYMFYTRTNLTFVADFTNNHPDVLSAVTLWTLSADNTETPIPLAYDASSDRWIGSCEFDYYTAPVNIALEYTHYGQKVFDRKQLNDFNEENESILVENLTEREEFIADYDSEENDSDVVKQLSELFSQDDPDEDEIQRLINVFGESNNSSSHELSDEEFELLCSKADDSWAEWEANVAPTIRETILSDFFADPDFDEFSEYEIISDVHEGTKTVTKKKLVTVNPEELQESGYSPLTLDDGKEIYVRYGDNLMEIVDCGQLIKYSVEVDPDTSSKMASHANAPSITPLFTGNYLSHAITAKNAIQAIAFVTGTDYRRWVVEVAEKIHEAAEGISRFYESFMNDFTENIQTVYNGLSVLNDDEIEAQEAIVEAGRERINGYNSKINDKKSTIALHEAERKEVFNSTVITEERKQTLLNELDEKIKNADNEIKSLKKKRTDDWEIVKKAEKKVKKIKKQSGLFRKTHTKIRETLDKFPKKLSKGLRMPKVLRVCGKVAGELGVPLQCWSLFLDMVEMADDISDWRPLMDYIDAHKCYKKGDADAVELHNEIYDVAFSHAYQDVNIIRTEIGAIAFSIAGGVPGSPTWWAEMGLSVVAEWWKYFNNNASINDRTRFWQEVGDLRCDDKDDEKDKEKVRPRKKRHYPFNPATPIHDPSGYVFEAVPENRVEGVQATIYYKETKEDMYGDPYEDIVLWDAEEYAQKNPLFTDENGMYQWDVPQGLWQVKFEKDGYVTAFSEWLPVPPPQLDVNIGIVQNKQPEVIDARAYEEGVEVQFDKFMNPSTLTTDNIYVTANGEKLAGEVRLMDSSLADEFADEEDADATRYASRVRFIPDEPLSVTTGEVRITVSRNVLSYAGIPMTETYSQAIPVVKEVQAIAAEDVKVLYGGEKEVTVFAAPFDASAGRTLRIATSSDMIVSVDTAEAILDDEGKAVIKVKGELPGRAQLRFTIDDVTVTGDCAVDVVTRIVTAEAPQASRASGTAVYKGTKVNLSTDSENATIYFTTDGSCPCDENGTRRKYTVPIVINEDMHILAVTMVGNGEEDMSEISEFNYTIKHSDMDFMMETGWNWISHNFDTPVDPAALAEDEAVSRILSQTQEVVRDPKLGMTGTLKELPASQSYKVETTTATARKRMSDIAWNPANPITLTEGWNWLGYPVGQTMTPDEAFAPTAVETLDVVVGQNGFAQYDGEKWVGTLETLTPGTGYMYHSQSAKSVVYNTSIVSTAAAKYVAGISDALPLALDIHRYATVMPMVAAVTDADNHPLDNEDYWINAFCGTECRGIGRLVNGLFMMNVYGNPGDAITFLVTDAEGKLEYPNTTAIEFSERIVGDIFNPFEIEINGTTGVRDTRNDGNVKVYAEGDMLRITGVASRDIELVEIYDTDGHKLLRESNVAESGIRLPKLSIGIYVVVVKADGTFSYHKIALR